MVLMIRPQIYYFLNKNHKKTLSPYSRRRITTTQTQNKTRQNYFTSLCLHIKYNLPNLHIHIYTRGYRQLVITTLEKRCYILYNYCIPSSLNFCCQAQAERNVSSMVDSAFHPNTLFARSGFAQTCSISPARRPTI